MLSLVHSIHPIPIGLCAAPTNVERLAYHVYRMLLAWTTQLVQTSPIYASMLVPTADRRWRNVACV